jgi:hypothetical protein
MLLRLAYLGITNAFTLLRLLPGSDQDKDTEITLTGTRMYVLAVIEHASRRIRILSARPGTRVPPG